MSLKTMGQVKDGRAVKTLTPGSVNPSTSAWTSFNPNDDITYSVDDLSVTFDFEFGVSDRAFISRVINVVSGESYAIRFRVTDKTGTFTRENVDILGDIASGVEVNNIGDGLRAVVVTANATGTITYRLGFGIDGADASGANAGFTLNDVMVEHLASGQTVSNEFILIDETNRASAGFARDNNSTLDAPGSGALLTESFGAIYDFTNNIGVGFISDSFGDESGDYVRKYETANEDKFVNATAVPGAKLQNVTNADVSSLALQGQSTNSNAMQSGIVVFQRAVNDIINDRTAVQVLADMDRLVVYAKSIGSGIVVCTCAPFGNNVGYTAGRETEALAFNSGLSTAYGSDPDVQIYDLFTTLEDPGTFNLLASLDSGDGLHPNSTGQADIAAAVEIIIDTVPAVVIQSSGGGSGGGRGIVRSVIG